MEHFKDLKRLRISEVNSILLQVEDVLKNLGNIIEFNINNGQEVTVVVFFSIFLLLDYYEGDTHGQYFDVLNIFALNGLPSSDNPYIINGDWVDRGSFGTEICIIFFCYKILYPNHFHILRGNHECGMCTREYGFKNEVNAFIYLLLFYLYFVTGIG
jgi:serine/threonine-protein phosphatase 5